MRFETLGPLRVSDESGVLPLRGRKARVLLAVLVSRAGDAVPIDVLARAIWDDKVPDTAIKTLRWHIHQLRRLLGDANRITYDDGGYRLRADPSEVDSFGFERLCADGFAAQRSRDPVIAARCFTEALKLWRGPAFGDLVDCGILRDEAARLDQLYLDATEQRHGVELDLGNHEEVLAELTELVERYPLRENLRAHLMVALYRCGRRSEALEMFRAGRELFAEQLGLDPAPRLRELEKAILNSDPALDPPSATRSGPAELPRDIATFTGREAEVSELTELLVTDSMTPLVISSINGGGGVGKSALAIHLGHLVRERFPDGQLYVNLQGATPNAEPLEPAEVLRRFLRSLGVGGDDGISEVAELANRLRTATNGKRMLFLLDDARDSGQVRPLLPSEPRCAVLITSRRTLSTLDGSVNRALDGLSDADAVTLLERLVGTDRVAAEPEAVRRLLGWCGGMPLALRICAARLVARPRWSVASLADELADETRRLSELEVDDLAIRSSFAVGYRQLCEDSASAARVFRLLGLHDGPDFTTRHVAALAELDEPDAERSLAELTATHLVEPAGPGRYRTHDLMRLFARERVTAEESAAERRASVERERRFYLGTVRNMLGVCEPGMRNRLGLVPEEFVRHGVRFEDAKSAYAWAMADTANLLAICRAAIGGGATDDPDFTATTVTVLGPVLVIRGSAGPMADLHELGIKARKWVTKPDLRFFISTGAAELMRVAGKHDEALRHLEVAMSISREQGWRVREGWILVGVGTMYWWMGELDQATDHLDRAVAIAAETGDRALEGSATSHLGHVHAESGRHDAAIEAMRKVLAFAQDSGRPRGRVEGMISLGRVYQLADRPTEARDCYERATAMLDETGLAGTRYEAEALWGLADAGHALGETELTRERWDRAAKLLFDLKLIDAGERDHIISVPEPDRPKAIRY
ncbi:AfsR/SARP family transcriptional regulator [Stackebrandtia nassauensis]|uniref:Transcriptional regulator, SARP family n=1 Tax=Stackebrandtia nassauensis (strain DSM 44728 / CIP 108903 / NRRL B-16338 / NBRC 102104 / LLR-40K-21) TaxID=446470 RepID=D3Q0C3_STANL|nr:BTAD domain-containing putative transcriptional regulator [Stackebrandtia nassauensis]ADD39787.1 transcriptional regulator, SARP family [Stackebrandtia nassauensis DSM 44728]